MFCYSFLSELILHLFACFSFQNFCYSLNLYLTIFSFLHFISFSFFTFFLLSVFFLFLLIQQIFFFFFLSKDFFSKILTVGQCYRSQENVGQNPVFVDVQPFVDTCQNLGKKNVCFAKSKQTTFGIYVQVFDTKQNKTQEDTNSRLSKLLTFDI